jgi:hypothetical protein
MSLIDIFKRDLISQAKRVIIGFPSDGSNGKATGITYTREYYEKESVNRSRSEKHRVVAQIAAKVFASDEMAEFIGKLVEQYADEVVGDSYEKSGLKEEDEQQAKNDVKVVVPKPAARKAAVKKPTTTAKTASKTPARKTAAKK